METLWTFVSGVCNLCFDGSTQTQILLVIVNETFGTSLVLLNEVLSYLVTQILNMTGFKILTPFCLFQSMNTLFKVAECCLGLHVSSSSQSLLAADDVNEKEFIDRSELVLDPINEPSGVEVGVVNQSDSLLVLRYSTAFISSSQ